MLYQSDYLAHLASPGGGKVSVASRIGLVVFSIGPSCVYIWVVYIYLKYLYVFSCSSPMVICRTCMFFYVGAQLLSARPPCDYI